MILAAGVEVLPEPEPTAPTPWLAAVLGLIAAGLAACAFWSWRQRPRRRPADPAASPDFGRVDATDEPPQTTDLS